MVIFFIRTQIEYSLGYSTVSIVSFTYFQILYRRTGSVNFFNYKFIFPNQTETQIQILDPTKNSLGHLNMIWNYVSLSIKTNGLNHNGNIFHQNVDRTFARTLERFNTQFYVVPNPVQTYWAEEKPSTFVQDLELRKTKY